MFPTMAQNKPPPMKLYILSDTRASRTAQEEKMLKMVVKRRLKFITNLSFIQLWYYDGNDDNNDDAGVWKYYRGDKCL